MHVEIYLNEYLKGELPRGKAEKVATHLVGCPRCREFAEWLGCLGRMADEACFEPPEDVVLELEASLLALPEHLTSTDFEPRPAPGRIEPIFRMPAWLAYPTPLLRTAALLMLGLLVGYGIWGTNGERGVDLDLLTPTERVAMRSEVSAAPAALTGVTAEELETRVVELEKILLISHLARVEATVLHFVTGATENEVAQLSTQATQNLLSVTANLKANAKESGDTRMTRLLGMIEMVLMEIDKICCDQDLTAARHVASVIEEQGLLSTLQRLKVALEE